MPNNMRKTVIFDLGNVLINWAPDEILQRFTADPVEREQYRQVFFSQTWLALDAGLIEYDNALKLFSLLLEKPLSEMERFMQTVRESLDPLPLALALLHDLARRKVDLICISNMPLHADAYLRKRYDYWHLFRGIVISAQVQLLKPHLDIFHYAIEQYQLAPDRSLFIDDSKANIDAAQKCGIQGVWYHNDQAGIEQVYRFLNQ
ncbi:HAD family phosphatase [Pasteurellaceae bacterium USgator11]|nr:HAD family phosphatase [Pasteurellaceae bacterium UScroc12]TNG97950.1 HAD family phosphatase [Pasteurellaceae bacterium USgator41]TNG99277.1 HAD family phosphatase [Pasteurellaceae bacterium UScroc31]TNH02700.1 HAD family phosphatase [Pasteurellaceae bacterium USgator11]